MADWGADRERWEDMLRGYETEAPDYDGWLDKYFKADAEGVARAGSVCTVIELGCGGGGDSLFLASAGCELICCDFAREALERVKGFCPGVETAEFDMRGPFPFADGFADAVVASLCLHFLDDAGLAGALSEIRRVLKDGGLLLCRLNSSGDYIKGIDGETELSPGAFMTRNGYKRFYDRETARRAFDGWNIVCMEEKTTVKFSKPKSLWELALRP